MSPWFDYPRYQWQQRHALVIGAGIAGCQISWHLAQQGWTVSLIERETSIARQASGNLAGVISPKMTAKPSTGEQFYHQAFDYCTQQLADLLAAGADVDWHPCGMLQLNHNERELQRWEALRARNLPADFLQCTDSEQTSQLAGIHCDYGATYFPRAGFINPASFCRALIQRPEITLISQVEAMNIAHDNDQWRVHDADGGVVAQAEILILASGKDINQFTDSTVFPQLGVLGQSSHATPTQGSSELKCVIGHEGYLTPSYQSQHVFGATFDREFEEIALSDAADQRNWQQLQEYFPKWCTEIAEVNSGHAAVRTTTPDRYPYAGAVPDTAFYVEHYAALKHGRTAETYPQASYQAGLFILGGFGSRGLTTSGLCAKLLSDCINNQIADKDQALLNTLHPARFLIRQLRRGELPAIS